MLRTEGNDYRNAATSPHVSPVVSRHRGPARPGDLAHRLAHHLRHAHRPGRSLGGARGGGLLLVVLGHGGPCLTVFLADHPRPTTRQVSGGGPPPQIPRRPGQPPRCLRGTAGLTVVTDARTVNRLKLSRAVCCALARLTAGCRW